MRWVFCWNNRNLHPERPAGRSYGIPASRFRTEHPSRGRGAGVLPRPAPPCGGCGCAAFASGPPALPDLLQYKSRHFPSFGWHRRDVPLRSEAQIICSRRQSELREDNPVECPDRPSPKSRELSRRDRGKKSGQFIGQHGEKVELLDLPGSYSLGAHARTSASRAMCSWISVQARRDPGASSAWWTPRISNETFISSHRSLNWHSTVIALNMIDVAEAQGTPVNAEHLSAEFRRPGHPRSEATRREGLLPLRLALSRAELPRQPLLMPDFPQRWTRSMDAVAAHWPGGRDSYRSQEAARSPGPGLKASVLLAASESDTVDPAAELGRRASAGSRHGSAGHAGQRTARLEGSPGFSRYSRIEQLCRAAQGG